jgi:hypothetical protein
MFFRGRSRNAKAADLAWTRDLLFAKGIRTQIKITMKIRITIKIKIKIKTGGDAKAQFISANLQ